MRAWSKACAWRTTIHTPSRSNQCPVLSQDLQGVTSKVPPLSPWIQHPWMQCPTPGALQRICSSGISTLPWIMRSNRHPLCNGQQSGGPKAPLASAAPCQLHPAMQIATLSQHSPVLRLRPFILIITQESCCNQPAEHSHPCVQGAGETGMGCSF